MASYSDILDEHATEYKNFTRLLLTLSVGFITLSVPSDSNTTIGLLGKYSILLHATSLICGIFVQFHLVKNPLDYLNEVSKSGKVDAIRNASPIERQAYLIQIIFFVLAFLCTIFSRVFI